MKYIIELEKIEGTELYQAKGFRTLIFDEYGIEKLEKLPTSKDIEAMINMARIAERHDVLRKIEKLLEK